MLALAACTGKTEEKRDEAPKHPPIRIRLEVTEGAEAERLAQMATAAFAEACPLWREHWYDVVSAVARYRSFGEYDYPRETYGWTRGVEIEIKLRQDTQTFDDPVPGYAGHTFSYLLGGNPKPGIVAGKRGAKEVCGMAATNGDDELKPVPGLSFL